MTSTLSMDDTTTAPEIDAETQAIIDQGTLLSSTNMEKIQRLAAQGAGLDPLSMAFVRMDCMLEVMGLKFRAEVNLAFERKLAEILDDVERQVSRSTLLQGVPGVTQQALAEAFEKAKAGGHGGFPQG